MCTLKEYEAKVDWLRAVNATYNMTLATNVPVPFTHPFPSLLFRFPLSLCERGVLFPLLTMPYHRALCMYVLCAALKKNIE